MKEESMTSETLAGELANILREDAEAEQAFRANPAKFLKDRFDWDLPEGCRIEIHDNTAEVWHIPMPAERAALGDAALAGVVGGAGADYSAAHYDSQFGKGNWRVVVIGLLGIVRVLPTQAGYEHARKKGLI